MTRRDLKSSSSAVLYGLTLAALFAALVLGFDVLTGVGTFTLVLGVYLVMVGWMPWARLGLALTTLGLIGAGLGLIGLGGLLLLEQEVVLQRPTYLLLPLVVVIMAAPLLLAIDARAHREAWHEWSQALREASLGDLLTGRHLRSSG